MILLSIASTVVARLAAAPEDPLGPVSQDPDAVRDAACKLTAPDQVCVPTPPPTTTRSGGSFPLADALLWLLFIGLVVALVVLIARALLARTPARRRRRAQETEAEPLDEVEVVGRTIIDPRRTPADWRAESDEHRRAGRFRDALRCRYRALVGDLARRNVIDEVPGRTTGEEREQLATVVPAGSPTFDAAADLFDGAWYGHVAVDDRSVAEMIELEAAVLQRIAVERPSGASR